MSKIKHLRWKTTNLVESYVSQMEIKYSTSEKEKNK